MSFEVNTATVVVPIISAILAALLSSWVSSWWTAKRIRDQAKWERTVSAYNDVLGSLSLLRWIAGTDLEDEEVRRERNESYSAYLRQQFRECMAVILRACEFADLHMSSKTKDALSVLISTHDRGWFEEDWFKVLEDRKEAVNKAICEIRKEADSAFKSR